MGHVGCAETNIPFVLRHSQGAKTPRVLNTSACASKLIPRNGNSKLSLAHEDLWCHVARGSALSREPALRHELLRKAEVRNLDEGVILLANQQQVLWLAYQSSGPGRTGFAVNMRPVRES